MARRLPRPEHLGKDLSAGLVLGIESVPDGMAAGLLAAVNPIYGLYGYMVGVFMGGLFTGSAFMAVQATGAMALVVASVPQVHQGETADEALFALAFLTGVFMVLGPSNGNEFRNRWPEGRRNSNRQPVVHREDISPVLRRL